MLKEAISAGGPVAPLNLDESGFLEESDDGRERLSAVEAREPDNARVARCDCAFRYVAQTPQDGEYGSLRIGQPGPDARQNDCR